MHDELKRYETIGQFIGEDTDKTINRGSKLKKMHLMECVIVVLFAHNTD